MKYKYVNHKHSLSKFSSEVRASVTRKKEKREEEEERRQEKREKRREEKREREREREKESVAPRSDVLQRTASFFAFAFAWPPVSISSYVPNRPTKQRTILALTCREEVPKTSPKERRERREERGGDHQMHRLGFKRASPRITGEKFVQVNRSSKTSSPQNKIEIPKKKKSLSPPTNTY